MAEAFAAFAFFAGAAFLGLFFTAFEAAFFAVFFAIFYDLMAANIKPLATFQISERRINVPC